MIKNISIRNFSSIGEEQSIDFMTTEKESLLPSVNTVNGKNYQNLVNCVVGSNGSGKTSFLKAITFIFWVMGYTYSKMESDKDIPYDSHKLHEGNSTSISIEFYDKNYDEYQYQIEVGNGKIIHELLGKKKIRDFSRIFEYTRYQNDWDFKKPSIKINKNDLERFKSKSNVSLLSSLIETGYLDELKVLKCLYSNVGVMGMHSVDPHRMSSILSNRLCDDSKMLEQVLVYLNDIDLGISGIDIVDVDIKENEDKKSRKIMEFLHKAINSEFRLDYFRESHGTRSFIYNLIPVLEILRSGGIVVLDEIETGMHPYVTKKLISLFEDKKTNPYGAQLIFSTHQHLLLNDRSKSQIFIAEKKRDNLESEVYRLDDVEGVRNDDNFFQKYLSGVYGGSPNIRWIN